MPRLVDQACLLLLGAAVLGLLRDVEAQTTWTSLEDRKGHAITSTPSGGVLMFGGESVETAGKLLNDTQRLSSNNKKWTAAQPLLLPLPRTEHALAAGQDGANNDVFVMFGGLRRLAIDNPATTITDDTFVYVGGDWVKIDPPAGTSAPSPRTGHAMVTDLIRNKVVLFGGFSGGVPRNDLWEFDPTTNEWTKIIPGFQPGSPPQRFDHSMTFDSLRGVIYLFGGSPFQNDTWEYDPSTQTWTDISLPQRPPGRRRAAISYLPTFDQVVLFGGQDNTLASLTDTWTFTPSPTGASWTQQTPMTSPPGRFEHAMAPDQLGTKAVLLGGADGGSEVLDSTWLWDGTNWTEEIAPPAPRTGVALAYDAARGKHVLFGGRSVPGAADLGDTWELEELTWTPRSPSPSPPARSAAGLCYDAARGVTVLFGGRQGGACGAPLGDTWEWDGTTWTLKAPSTSPPAAADVQPVFDRARGVTWMLVGADLWKYDGSSWQAVAYPHARANFALAASPTSDSVMLFGGETAASVTDDETWEWQRANGWTRRLPVTVPAARRHSAMVFDAYQQQFLHFGGQAGSTGYTDTRLWNGVDWTASVASLSDRHAFAAAYMGHLNQAVAFGGIRASNGATLNATTVFSSTAGAWSSLTPPSSPSARYVTAMAYDPARGVVVLFGGRTGPGSSAGDTWEFDGTNWADVTPATPSPPARGAHAMAYHPPSGDVVLYGGSAAAGGLPQTWLWDGAAWTQANPAHSPGDRIGHRMVTLGDSLLLFHGTDVVGEFHEEVFEWNGADWLVVDSGRPASRTRYGAAYDARRDRLVLFGGREQCDSGMTFGDTWEWSGTAWLRRTPTASPSPREGAQLAYDAHRSRVVLFGGFDPITSTTFSDTWEWNGDNWVQRAPTSVPGASSDHAMSYDAGRRLSVLFGTPGTWDYGSERPGLTISTDTVSTCLSVLGTTPQLVPTEWNGPWVGDSIGLDFVDLPPGIPILLFGFTPLPLPLNLFFLGQPLCELAVSPDVIEPLFPFVPPYESGPLPTTPSLQGVSLYAQAAFLDLFGGPLVTSNSLQLTLGSK